MADQEGTPRTRLHSIGSWTLGRTLGRGAYAHVRLATHPSGHQAACKILPALHRPRSKPITRDEIMDAVEAYKEVVLLKALAGAGIKGIVGLEGVIQEDGWTYIFLTLHNASASQIKKTLKLRELIYFFRQLLRTVHALHVLSVSHEDIKRSNILFSSDGRPVLVDFGFSHFKADGGKAKSAGGTLDYSSPEKVEDTIQEQMEPADRQDTRYDPQASDVWSLGILLLKLLGKPHPYMLGDEDETSDRVRVQIMQGWPRYRWTAEEARPGGFAELIMGMLDKNPVKRLKISEIIAHPSLQFQHHTITPWKLPIPRRRSTFSESVIEEVAFLAYLNQEFFLCESYAKIKERLSNSTISWEKQWAGFLCRWKGREDIAPAIRESVRRRVSGLRNQGTLPPPLPLTRHDVSTPTKIVGRPLQPIQGSFNIQQDFRRGTRPSGIPLPIRKTGPEALVKRQALMKPPKPGPYVGPKIAAQVKNTHVVINSPKRQAGGPPLKDFARSRQALVKTSRTTMVGSPTLATLGGATRNRIPLYSTGGLVSTAPSAAGSDDEGSDDEDENPFKVQRRERGIKAFPKVTGARDYSRAELEAGPSKSGESDGLAIRRSNRLGNKGIRVG